MTRVKVRLTGDAPDIERIAKKLRQEFEIAEESILISRRHSREEKAKYMVIDMNPPLKTADLSSLYIKLVEMIKKLEGKDFAPCNPVWHITPKLIRKIMNIAYPAGNPIFIPGTKTRRPTLLGYPVMEESDFLQGTNEISLHCSGTAYCDSVFIETKDGNAQP